MGKTGEAYEKFMQEKFRLIDGTQAFAIRKLKCDIKSKVAFQCLCCRVHKICGVDNLLTHVNGKKHKKNLERSHDPRFITINERAEDQTPVAFQSFQSQSTSSSSIDSQEFFEKPVTFNETEESRKIRHKIDAKYEEYKQIPTSHPKYNEKFEEFRLKRSSEVKAKGLDPNNYDFKPDWIIYWKDRLEELLEEDTKMELLKRLQDLQKEETKMELLNKPDELQSHALNTMSKTDNVETLKDSSMNEQSSSPTLTKAAEPIKIDDVFVIIETDDECVIVENDGEVEDVSEEQNGSQTKDESRTLLNYKLFFIGFLLVLCVIGIAAFII